MDIANLAYCSEREAGKLFSESYESVGVMFASLPNYINFFSEAEINQGQESAHSLSCPVQTQCCEKKNFPHTFYSNLFLLINFSSYKLGGKFDIIVFSLFSHS